MQKQVRYDFSIYAAALTCAALIAHQVGGKATRDALFLSQFPVSSLAWMVVVASILAIVTGAASARLMSRIPPSRLIPRAFLASAVLLGLQWTLSNRSNALVAVLLYLQMAALGSTLISGFWSLLGDRFDPHSARKHFGRVVAAGTVGGMIGGFLAERVGTSFGVTSMLPVLAALDLVSAILTTGLARGITEPTGERRPKEDNQRTASKSRFTGLRMLRDEPYLRSLALIIVLTTLSGGLLDFVFKARAVAAYHGGPDLVRFFAVFYTGIGVITFLVQIGLSRASLEKMGLAGTIGSLPFAVAVGGFGALIPGVWSATFARASEAVLRSSLFRSGYELFFAAVPQRERRRVKPLLDIGFDRLGDILGGALITVFLLAGSVVATPLMLVVAAAAGIIGLLLSRQLHHGYVDALENNLLNQSIHIELSDIRDSTTRSAVLRTLSNGIRIPETKDRPAPPIATQPKVVDPVLNRVSALRSNNPESVRAALRQPLDATLAAHVITLLAWDEVAEGAVTALQKTAPSIIGQLVDGLLDPLQEFAVRRRIPRVLSVTDSQRAFDGLVQGLFDHRFEVRFQSGRALAQIQDRATAINADHSLITQAVLRELSVEKGVWESRSLIDAQDHKPSNVSSEHVFRLLSLILPKEPLRIAYRGLYSEDERWKGMALEYLETVLPEEVRKTIRPLLETA
jgi:ATP:ADP antiporter, AAA family